MNLRIRLSACLPVVTFAFAAGPATAQDDGADARASDIKAAIRAGLPKYQPATKRSLAAAPPADGVVRLPEMIVRERKPIDLTERTLLTPAARSALLRRRFPGASLPGQDPDHSVLPNYAALMDHEERRLHARRDFSEMSDLIQATGDVEKSQALRRAIRDAFQRGRDPLTEAMERSMGR